MPKRYNPNASIKPAFSGRRVKRGLYKSSDGTLLNADTNGAYNILRKTDSDFSFAYLIEKVGNRITRWLHPVKRVRFWLKKEESKVTLSSGEGIMGWWLPYSLYWNSHGNVEMSIVVNRIVIYKLTRGSTFFVILCRSRFVTCFVTFKKTNRKKLSLCHFDDRRNLNF